MTTGQEVSVLSWPRLTFSLLSIPLFLPGPSALPSLRSTPGPNGTTTRHSLSWVSENDPMNGNVMVTKLWTPEDPRGTDASFLIEHYGQTQVEDVDEEKQEMVRVRSGNNSRTASNGHYHHQQNIVAGHYGHGADILAECCETLVHSPWRCENDRKEQFKFWTVYKNPWNLKRLLCYMPAINYFIAVKTLDNESLNYGISSPSFCFVGPQVQWTNVQI